MLAIAPMTLPEVRQEWAHIRNGLMKVIGACEESWMPEDAWSEIMAGNAFVWKIEAAQVEVGFLLLKKQTDFDGPTLFVWALYAAPQSLARHKEELFDRLKELAHRIGSRRIRMESSRKGWQGFDYFKPVRTIYEATV